MKKRLTRIAILSGLLLMAAACGDIVLPAGIPDLSPEMKQDTTSVARPDLSPDTIFICNE